MFITKWPTASPPRHLRDMLLPPAFRCCTSSIATGSAATDRVVCAHYQPHVNLFQIKKVTLAQHCPSLMTDTHVTDLASERQNHLHCCCFLHWGQVIKNCFRNINETQIKPTGCHMFPAQLLKALFVSHPTHHPAVKKPKHSCVTETCFTTDQNVSRGTEYCCSHAF